MAREESPQTFAVLTALVETLEETLDGIGNIRGGATITDRPRDRGELADASPNAEVICVDHPAIHFDFLAFDADVGDPMLAAAVWAAGNVDSKLFLKVGEALFE